jgi:phosphate transport system substrate-binding protein
MAQLGAAFEEDHPDTQVEIFPSLGSSGGIKALLAGAIDVGLSARALKGAEREAGASARIYARTPLAVVTSSGTEADGVTTADLVAIYSGTMTHWPDGSPIRLIMRPAEENDTQLLRTLSGPMAKAVDHALERQGLVSATNDQENAETLEDVPGSVGVVALGQITTEQRKLKVLTLDGNLPQVDRDFDPETSFAKTLYVVSREEMSPAADQFIAFVFSAKGRDILAATDHAPVP